VTIRTLAVREGDDQLLEPAPEELAELLADPSVTLWVDLDDNGRDEERLLSEVFSFRDLVVEDVFEEAQAKLEDHGEYLYLILHGLHPQHKEPHDVVTYELDLFLGARFVLTHHPRISPAVAHARSRIQADPGLMREGAAFVAHAIIDYMIDSYTSLIEQFERTVIQLEVDVYRRHEEDVLERIMDLKQSLQLIRRVGIHQKEILRRLRSPGLALIPEPALPFFGDVHDHFVTVTDVADSLRDLVQGNLDAFISVQSHKMNEIVKVLTLISTIMLPLHLIAGIYGMNFRHMPELAWPWGYPFALLLMAIVAGGLLYLFKRRRWL
jgi:magnesium transporter